MRILFTIGLAAASAAIACQAIAGPIDHGFSAQQSSPAFKAEKAVEPATLDSYRGGFTDPNGLVVSLGIERVITINGNVAATTKLNFGDLGSLASGRTTLSPDAANQLALVQNGGGAFNVQFGPSVLGGTVIQNSLNNQLINNATIINASVNARGMLQAMNFQSTLSNALNTAVSGR
jgi:hypothetical protein